MVAEQHKRNQRHVGGIEYMFTLDPYYKFAADGDYRRGDGEHDQVGPKQQSQGERGNQRTHRVEAGQARESRANELDGLGSQQDGDSVLPPNAEVESEHADTEQCGQHSDLVVAGIGQSGYQFHARC